MKLIPALICALLFSSATAMACPRNQNQFVCPGDRVVNKYGQMGRVATVNPFEKRVSVVADGSSFAQEFPVSDVYLGLGCLEGACAEDRAVSRYGQLGRIVGVNPYERRVAFMQDGGMSATTFGIDDIYLGYGCLRGYCVGDTVSNRYGQMGKLLAINYAEGRGAMMQYEGMNAGLYPITELGSAAYCDDYGSNERSVGRYPDLSNMEFVSASFRFSMNRPHRGGGQPRMEERRDDRQQDMRRDDRRDDRRDNRRDERRGGGRRGGPNRR